VELETLARLYAAEYIKKADALAVAELLYDIMDISVREDGMVEQETTKKFLERIVQIMNEHDEEYTQEVTKEYLSITIELIKGIR
jgi:activator of HSP90 ATPase